MHQPATRALWTILSWLILLLVLLAAGIVRLFAFVIRASIKPAFGIRGRVVRTHKFAEDTNYDSEDDPWRRDWARVKVVPQAESWSDFLARVELEDAGVMEVEAAENDQHCMIPGIVPEHDTAPPVELDVGSYSFSILLSRLSRDIIKIKMQMMEARSRHESWIQFLDRVEQRTATVLQPRVNGLYEELERQLHDSKELYAKVVRASSSSLTVKSTNSVVGAVELDDMRADRIAPAKEHRPCTEPPILDYTSFELIIAAQKELDKKLGSRDIAWRTEGMDTVVEIDLLNSYNGYLLDSLTGSSDPQESAFLYGLKRELQQDFEEVRMEMVQVAERHGKDGYALQELITGIRDIVQENNPTATIELSAFSYYERYPIEFSINADEEGNEE